MRNRQEFFDKNEKAEKLGISSSQWSLFGIVWPSSIVLANYMLKKDCTNKKVLEIGCGIGLSSLLLNKQKVNITATDYHPEVQTFLNNNTKLNNDIKIPFVLTNWTDTKNSELLRFDIIIGSDLLYERDSAKILSNFINNHAKKSCTVILVDPKRGYEAKFSKYMLEFGFKSTKEKSIVYKEISEDYKGNINCYYR